MTSHETATLSRPIKTLVLEDDEFDRKRIRRLTRNFDIPIEIDEAPTLQELSNKMKQGTYDLILLDYGLPEGNGLDALNLIQKNTANKNARTIMISGNDQRDVAISAFRNGCSDFITKDELDAQILKKAMQSTLKTMVQSTIIDHPEFNQMIHKEVEYALSRSLNQNALDEALEKSLRNAVDKVGLNISNRHDEQKKNAFWSAFLSDDDFEYNNK